MSLVTANYPNSQHSSDRMKLSMSKCKWIIQSRGQQAAYAEKLAAKEAADGLVVKNKKKEEGEVRQRENKGERLLRV